MPVGIFFVWLCWQLLSHPLADDLAEDSCTIEPSSGPPSPVLRSRELLGNRISFAGRLSYCSTICVRGIVKCNKGSESHGSSKLVLEPVRTIALYVVPQLPTNSPKYDLQIDTKTCQQDVIIQQSICTRHTNNPLLRVSHVWILRCHHVCECCFPLWAVWLNTCYVAFSRVAIHPQPPFGVSERGLESGTSLLPISWTKLSSKKWPKKRPRKVLRLPEAVTSLRQVALWWWGHRADWF